MYIYYIKKRRIMIGFMIKMIATIIGSFLFLLSLRIYDKIKKKKEKNRIMTYKEYAIHIAKHNLLTEPQYRIYDGKTKKTIMEEVKDIEEQIKDDNRSRHLHGKRNSAYIEVLNEDRRKRYLDEDINSLKKCLILLTNLMMDEIVSGCAMGADHKQDIDFIYIILIEKHQAIQFPCR